MALHSDQETVVVTSHSVDSSASMATQPLESRCERTDQVAKSSSTLQLHDPEQGHQQAAAVRARVC